MTNKEARASGSNPIDAQQDNWIAVATMSAATLVLTIDLFGVSVALPTIGRELGGSTSSLQWVTNAYSLSLAALLIPAGRISDLVGRRRVAVLGLVSFALASLACGTAQSMEILIVARAAQGVP